MNNPSRLLRQCAVAAAMALLSSCAYMPSGGPGALGALPDKDADQLKRYAIDLDGGVRRHIKASGLARKDGYLYTMDVAPLMIYAVERRDAGLYADLVPAVQQLVLQDPNEPFQQGFVVWRIKKGQPLEVTGAFEAIWMARALWLGGSAFQRPGDRELAMKILDGYAKHAFELSGYWMVRRYYSFEARTFSNYSVLPAYNADFFAEVEKAVPGGKTWKGFGERSYAMLDRSRAPSGLLYPISEPEIGLAYPGVNGDVFGPRNIAALEDACYAAEGALKGKPEAARNVVNFVTGKRHQGGPLGLYAYYQGESGDPTSDVPLSTTGFACLMRLAVGVHDGSAVKDLSPYFMPQLQMTAQMLEVQPAPLYVAGPMLMTMYAMGAFGAPANGTSVTRAKSGGDGDQEQDR